jgi:hypothetical protein
MKKITWTNVLTIAGAIGGAIIGNWAVSVLFSGDAGEDKTKFLMSTASEINKNLPMNVDSETVLIATIGAKETFTYNYQLPNYEKDNLDLKTFVETMTPNVTNFVCSTKEMQAFRDLNIFISYNYYDTNHKQITEIKVDTKQCQKI